jgi:hypothetical protein
LINIRSIRLQSTSLSGCISLLPKEGLKEIDNFYKPEAANEVLDGASLLPKEG